MRLQMMCGLSRSVAGAWASCTMSGMTAKEQPRRKVEELSEQEAAQAPAALERTFAPDPLDELLDNPPPDDEPVTPEDEAAVAEAGAELARGEAFSHERVWEELLGSRETRDT
jgi:hypothetical protein